MESNSLPPFSDFAADSGSPSDSSSDAFLWMPVPCELIEVLEKKSGSACS